MQRVFWRYHLDESIEDFDPAGLEIAGNDEIAFKEAVMLISRLWYPTREALHSGHDVFVRG